MAQTPASPQFPLFDGLRGIACLSIFVFHVVRYAPVGTTLGPFVFQLNFSVCLFFMVSGFLLYRPYAQRRFEGRPPLRTGPYAVRRVLRVIPGYWVALAVIVLVL